MDILKTFDANEFDAIITDPPYSSGGMYRGDRALSTRSKYMTSGPIAAEYAKHSFSGDNMDQLSFMQYSAEWMRQARRVTKEGGAIAIFCDWRQLAAAINALQMAGWVYRGVAVWDKIAGRPQKGRFRQQSEFLIWGSNGPMPFDRNAPILPVVIQCAVPPAKTRIHQTQKPLELMRIIVQICEKGGKILDPFAGSGSTLTAAGLEGFDGIEIEIDEYYFNAAHERLSGR